MIMFYRRKLIIALLETIGTNIEKTKLIKMIFLLTQKQNIPTYDFLPFKYGCYSFSLGADLETMIKKDWLQKIGNEIGLSTDQTYFEDLIDFDQILVKRIVKLYGVMTSDRLTRLTYCDFPYYAIKSSIARNMLSEENFKNIAMSMPNNCETVLYTIGYEGISLDYYLNKLIKNNIGLLIDVRRKPISRKFGFSKKSLHNYCSLLNINYINFSEVGIDTLKRKSINDKSDYEYLFEEYRNSTLRETTSIQKKILGLLTKYKRIALTCFEADSSQCHRSHLSDNIKTLSKFRFKVIHL